MKFTTKLPDRPGWWACDHDGYKHCYAIEFLSGTPIFRQSGNKCAEARFKWSTEPISFDDTPTLNTFFDDKVLALVEAAWLDGFLAVGNDASDVAWNKSSTKRNLEAARGEQAATVDRRLFDRAVWLVMNAVMEGHVAGLHGDHPVSSWGNSINKKSLDELKEKVGTSKYSRSALVAEAGKGNGQ